ncbi:hypothetical protein GCM10010411_61360 [Actinomadura fulvescens]|uniref:Uncharacterized protein n=1 Tax=Actinomadura fulvescens TaxID=46160 RepID=A0ABP6CEV4_9ACTN
MADPLTLPQLHVTKAVTAQHHLESEGFQVLCPRRTWIRGSRLNRYAQDEATGTP